MSKTIVPLVSVCDFQGGTQPPKSEWITRKKEGYIRMLQIRDFTQERSEIEYVPIKSNLKTCKEDDILIARYGASIGKIMTGQKGAYNVAIIKTIPDERKIIKKYLYYYLKSNIFQNFVRNVGTRAAQAGFNKQDLESLEIYLPSIKRQQQIVNLLDKAFFLIYKRKQQISAASSLTQSVFLKMFGDPFSNKYNLEKLTISDVIVSLEAGLSTGGENKEKLKNEMGVLTTSAVTYGIFNPKAYKVPSKKIDNKKKLIHPTKFSILVSRMNTKELVGASCIVEEDHYDLFIPDRIWKISLNLDIINPYYFISYIQQSYFKAMLSKEATGTSGSMLNISQQKFKDMKILVPSIEKQNKFAQITNEVNNNKTRLENSLKHLEKNSNSLLHRAFNGELFND